MIKHKRLSDAYRFPGFQPKQRVIGIFGDPKARVIRLNRIEKKHVVQTVAGNIEASMITKYDGSEIFPVETRGYILIWKSAVLNVRIVRK
jgi:hypothetical protein